MPKSTTADTAATVDSAKKTAETQKVVWDDSRMNTSYSNVCNVLGSREEINYIYKMLEQGTGADRQLRVFKETGDIKAVVDYIIEETAAGLD